MESFDEDQTLPLDPDGSGHITRLQEDDVSFNEATNMMSRSHPNTDFSMSSGKMSPGAGSHSMKEFSEVMSQLKKENFRLKLRIFYMEEKMQKQFDGDQEEHFKTNIELKVECDSLRKELQDKNDLLVKATNAVACFESNPDEVAEMRREAQREIQELKEALEMKNHSQHQDLEDAQEEVERLTQCVKDLQKKVEDAHEENKLLNEKLAKVAMPDENLDTSSPQHDDDPNDFQTEEVKLLREDNEQKEIIIKQLRDSLQTKQSVIEVLTEDKSNLDNLVEDNKLLKKQLSEKTAECAKHIKIYEQEDEKNKDHISEQQLRLDEFEVAVRQMSEELEKRDNEVKDLKAVLNDAEEDEKRLKDKPDPSVDMQKEIIMRDKAINGFTAVIRKKDEEIEGLKDEISKQTRLVEELNKIVNNKKSVDKRKDELIIELREQLKEQNNTLQMALDDKMRTSTEVDSKLRKSQNMCNELERTNKHLEDKLKDSEELVKQLDSELKEKDKKLQDLLNKFKALNYRVEELEQARLNAVQERDEIQNKFEEEKQYFSDLTKKLQDQLHDHEDDNQSKQSVRQMSDALDALNKKVKDMEIKAANKDNKIRELSKKLSEAEHEKKLALSELESMVSQRSDESNRESESKHRLSDIKNAELNRLRSLLREKDLAIQELEEQIVKLDGQLKDRENDISIASRKIALWKEENTRKDAALEELRQALEELLQSSLSPDHHQLIALTKENVELKLRLKACESEIEFLKSEREAVMDSANDNPYIESLKREIARKDQLLKDARTYMNTDVKNQSSEMDLLAAEAEKCKREMITVQRSVESLKHENEQKDYLLQKLHESEKAKNQLIQDLKVANSQGKIPTIESDEESYYGSESTDNNKQRRKHRLHHYENVQTATSPNSIRYTESSKNTMYTETELQFTESDSEVEVNTEDQRTIECLRDEVEILKDELNRLASENNDLATENGNQRLWELQNLITREIESYNNIKTIESQKQGIQTEDDLWNVSESLHQELDEVKKLREDLSKLYSQFNQNNHNENSSSNIPTQTNSGPVTNDNHEEEPKLETVMQQLSDSIREQADLQKKLTDAEETKEKLIVENTNLRYELDKMRISSEYRCKELREEVDKLRLLRNGDRTTPDDDVSLSGEESDGMSLLSIQELREVIKNQRTKIINTEKVNYLLKDQLNKATPEFDNVHKLEEEVADLKKRLTAASQSKPTSSPTKLPSKSKSLNALKSKLPVPVDKAPTSEDPETKLRRALNQAQTIISDLRKVNIDLQTRVAATEETVRVQTEKLKRQSLNESSTTDRTTDVFTQTSTDESGYLSVSPRTEQRFNSLIQAQSRELSIFRQQLAKSRTTSKHLQVQVDVINRYMDTMLSSIPDTVDSMLANGLTSELDRCRRLTKRLQEQLAERNADTSLSDSDSDNTWAAPSSPLALRRQSSKYQKMVENLKGKDKQIAELENKLKNLQGSSASSFEKQYFKKDVTEPPRDLLTPSTSQHSAFSETDEEVDCRPGTISATEYQSLPENNYHHSRVPTTSSQFSPLRNALSATDSRFNRSPITADGTTTPTNQHHLQRLASYERDISIKNEEIDRLRHELNESERINRGLQDEIYQQSQMNNQGTNTSFASPQHDTRNPADIFDEHLNEIRALRQRLEASIEINDRLREQLIKKLNENGEHPSADNVSIYLPNDSVEDLTQENRNLKQQIENMNKDVDHLRKQNQKLADTKRHLTDMKKELADKQIQTKMLADHVNQLAHDLQQANNTVSSLTAQVDTKDAKIDQLQNDLKEMKNKSESSEGHNVKLQRLNSKCTNLEDQLNESNQFVQTLKTELDLYEKIHGESHKEPASPDMFNLSSFLNEIRQLRVQLEQSIDANAALRKQLEEQLKHGNVASPGRLTTINIHHMSPNEQNMSPRSRAKKKLKLDEDPAQNTHGLMTPPPSAHSRVDGLSPSNGFSFESDDEKPGWKKSYYNTHNNGYVVGKYISYASLKQKILEGKLALQRMDVSTPHNQNEFVGSIAKLENVLRDSSQLLKGFWPADMPPTANKGPFSRQRSSASTSSSRATRDAGFGSDSSVGSDADVLRKEVSKLRKRLTAQDSLLQTTVDRLQNANKMKEGIEHAILKQLSVTHDVLKKARGNLEVKAKTGKL